ncbi:MAG: teichoic acid biosynthesis protein [Polyangiaceae bacterium]|nr:teichoic acid biosynthesis protein [Polyangiaceae bacterium]
MRILYGVVGEGMGHATRSRVVLEHLARSGHEVRVVVSGRAHRFLVERLQAYKNVTIEEIHGITLTYADNRLDKSRSLFRNLRDAPKGLRKNLEVYRRVAEDGFRPRLVVSDFESWAAFYALNHVIPVVSVDNMQILDRCRHDPAVTAGTGFNTKVIELAVKMKLPGAYHYLVTSFFYPPVAKKRTTLVPPILRREILEAKREPGDHVLVYQTSESNRELLPALRKLPHRFRVYGMGREGSEGNVTLCAFSERGFVDDLRTARAVISGGGFTLMSEAVTLHVPMLSVPIERQYEQELNARYLAHLGYGAWAQTLDLDTVSAFLERTDDYAHALEKYQRRDNSLTFGCLDELIERCQNGDKRPKRLLAPAMGKWEPEDDDAIAAPLSR